ncbi:hypothetical protein [Candidatus Thiodiazotropha endoloripes]|nr:hypothetical protein [Candidatus Thiodiazotropha endoloripes]
MQHSEIPLENPNNTDWISLSKKGAKTGHMPEKQSTRRDESV